MSGYRHAQFAIKKKAPYVCVCLCDVKQEVVDEMTSQTADVVRRRDRDNTSVAPAAFRR